MRRRPRHRIYEGDALQILRGMPSGLARCCVTSPPYFGLRDYGMQEQIGLEPTLEAYVERLVGVFREVRRVLADDGTLWVVVGDSFAFGGCGSRNPNRWPKQSRNDHQAKHAKKVDLPPKSLIGVPWTLAFALRDDGWILRSDIIYAKPNPMPESVRDRPTRSHEYVFLFSKNGRYCYDADAIMEDSVTSDPRRPYTSLGAKQLDGRAEWHGGEARKEGVYHKRNRRSVWTVSPKSYKKAHFATFPPALVEPMILAGSQLGDVVLDPFAGAATTGVVAARLGRRFRGIELNPAYVRLGAERMAEEA